jgi:serine/threonine protein kinase
VLHQVGVGALGPVFRTYEPSRDRLVAVKVFRLDITPEQAQSLADELGRAVNAGLFHPSIVEPVAAGLEGTVAYRAEEYVAAESLDVAMRHYAPAALDNVMSFITQLASAIDSARGAGVGHGALHPRDIFVTPDEARATGFGVVDALDRLGLRAPVRRPYSPPERIAGEPWGTAADVFSLAAIAFELLTGRRPSGVGDQIGPLTGAVAGVPAERIRAVLARAMHERSADRYPTAMEFASALDRAARQPEVRPIIPLDPDRATKPQEPAVVPPAIEEPAAMRAAPAIPVTPEPPALVLATPVADEAPIPEPEIERPSPPELRPFEVVRGGADRAGIRVAEPEKDVPTPDAAPSNAHEPPSIEESPREVARKMIAAREVRRREIKRTAQPALDLSTFAPETPAPVAAVPKVAPAPEPEPELDPVPALPELPEVPADNLIVAVEGFRASDSIRSCRRRSRCSRAKSRRRHRCRWTSRRRIGSAS